MRLAVLGAVLMLILFYAGAVLRSGQRTVSNVLFGAAALIAVLLAGGFLRQLGG